MKSARIFALAVTIFVVFLTACGKTNAEKETDEATTRTEETNSDIAYLNNTYLINLNPLDGKKAAPNALFIWLYTDDSLKDIETRLQDVIGHCNRIIELTGHDSFRRSNGVTDLVTVRANAQIYLDAITKEKTARKSKSA